MGLKNTEIPDEIVIHITLEFFFKGKNFGALQGPIFLTSKTHLFFYGNRPTGNGPPVFFWEKLNSLDSFPGIRLCSIF